MRQFISYILLVFPVTIFAATQSSCSQEWSDLASDFGTFFIDDGTCSNAARAAIRLAFHDCFPGTCDGSIINAQECTDREENAQMVDICTMLNQKADEYGVGTADVIQFAAAIGLASCTGGPVTSFYSGREDSFSASHRGSMPDAQTDARTMVDLFSKRNFSKTELVALTGAHTIGRQLDGTDMDSTAGVWDNKFYHETSGNSAPGSVAADTFMAQAGETGEEWRTVGKTQKSFTSAFVPAMEKLSLLGNDKSNLVDCSVVVKSYARNAKVQRRVLLSGRKLESCA